MNNILAALVVLGLLILVHESGHFIAAKLLGVGVRRFSLGFGPRLLSRKVRDTEYCISVVPFGGYVKMVGEVPGEELDPADLPRSFTHKPLLSRFTIVLAGPLFNMIFACLVFCGIFAVHGVPVYSPEIGGVQAGMPAARAGLLKGDVVVAIGGKPVNDWEHLSEAIRANAGGKLAIMVERGGKYLAVEVRPETRVVPNMFGEKESKPVIGVAAAGKVVVHRVGALAAIGQGAGKTYELTEITILSVVKLIQRVLPADTLGGPIMIAQIAGQTAQQGLMTAMLFAASLSINLGVLNLLPIPVLDGGHLMFFGIEALMGRPVSLRKREVAQQVGLFLILSLIVFVFYNDISRIAFD
ncbi:MAG: RIP metalloprotease RseP [Pseudomonadota bacterium]